MVNAFTRPISLYKETESSELQCIQCQRMCIIRKESTGYCKTVQNIGGVLKTRIYGLVSSAASDPIEKKPLYHFKPGSLCYSVGSLGCNFRCDFCQNWQIAYCDPAESISRLVEYMSPKDLVSNALNAGCEGVAWTYNEPSIWYEYTLDSARLCKQNGLYTVYVTNGYATKEHLDGIAPYLDAYRVDIKSMDNSFYQKFASVPSVDGILKVTQRARHKWGMHVECVTNIVPGENDSVESIRAIAEWIVNNLGKETPWHITRFFPHSKLSDKPATPISTLQQALSIGKDSGLLFVYLGNVNIPQGMDTICPKCGVVLIERYGYRTVLRSIDQNGLCINDGTAANVRM